MTELTFTLDPRVAVVITRTLAVGHLALSDEYHRDPAGTRETAREQGGCTPEQELDRIESARDLFSQRVAGYIKENPDFVNDPIFGAPQNRPQVP